jgi:hypothetical protein
MLKDSKSDIIYFMIMFCIIVLGFSVMASTLYGENLAEFSDFIGTLNQLMIWLLGFFNYYAFAPYSSLTPLIFLLFTMVVSLFLFNMMVAIIVAHYNEYMEL